MKQYATRAMMEQMAQDAVETIVERIGKIEHAEAKRVLQEMEKPPTRKLLDERASLACWEIAQRSLKWDGNPLTKPVARVDIPIHPRTHLCVVVRIAAYDRDIGESAVKIATGIGLYDPKGDVPEGLIQAMGALKSMSPIHRDHTRKIVH